MIEIFLVGKNLCPLAQVSCQALGRQGRVIEKAALVVAPEKGEPLTEPSGLELHFLSYQQWALRPSLDCCHQVLYNDPGHFLHARRKRLDHRVAHILVNGVLSKSFLAPTSSSSQTICCSRDPDSAPNQLLQHHKQMPSQ